MNLTQRIVGGVTVVLIAMTILAQTYKAGERAAVRRQYVSLQEANREGYSMGWSDAQCGKGVDCEAGQE